MKYLAVLVMLFYPALAWAWPATVLSVSDGDTLLVAPCGDKKTAMSVRLYGIDAPEKKQPGGKASTQWLREALPEGSAVEIISQGMDKYGRTLALVSVDGKIVNGLSVEQGQAWVYPKYCKARFCRTWTAAQKRARQNKTGLWESTDRVPPWDWRRREK